MDRCKDLQSSVLEKVYLYYRDSTWCDVKVIINNNRYFAHKLILVSHSEYFKEALNENVDEIIVNSEDQFKREVVENLFQYFYTGNIQGFQLENFEDVLKLAKLVKCVSAVKFCLLFLEKQFNAQNIIKIRQIAEHLNDSKLIEKAKKKLLVYFEQVVEYDDFLILNTVQLLECLDSDELDAKEDVVFKGLKLWCLADLENRKEDFCSLLSHVRLSLLSPKYIVNEVVPFIARHDMFSCSEVFLKNLLTWQILPNERKQLNPIMSKPRNFNFTLLAILDNEIKKYEFETASWLTHVKKSAFPDFISPPVLYEDKIVVAGGGNRNRVYCVSLKTGENIEFPSMNDNRSFCATVVANGRLFVCGGKTYSTEEYNPTTRMWYKLPDMIDSRYCHSIAVSNEKIYIFGGKKNEYWEQKVPSSARVFNPMENSWKNITSMKTRHKECEAVVLGDHIYVLDNWSNYKRPMERFDTVSETWMSMADGPALAHNGRTVVFQNKIIYFGEKHNMSYDPEKNEWMFSNEFPTVDIKAYLMWVPTRYLK